MVLFKHVSAVLCIKGYFDCVNFQYKIGKIYPLWTYEIEDFNKITHSQPAHFPST